jgi:chromosome segregation ATPase
LATSAVFLERAANKRDEYLRDLRSSEADHAATHEDLAKAETRIAQLEALAQDLRNQMISQGQLLDEQKFRMARLEGWIDRVREVDSLDLGMRPAEAIPDAV